MRVLLTTQPGQGHWNPLAPYATALMASGHEVLVACSESFRPTIERAGVASAAAGVDYSWEFVARTFPDSVAAAGENRVLDWAAREVRFGQPLGVMAEDVGAIAAQFRPDLVVREFAEDAGQLIAESRGLPWVTVAWGLFMLDLGLDVHAEWNEWRRRFGLPSEVAYDSMYRSLTLSPVPPSWTALSDPLPSRLVNVRVEPDDGATSTLMGWSPSRIRRRPFVYATLGTVVNGIGQLRKLAAALGTLDADVLLTTGSRNDPVDVDAPPNVQIERYVPQSLVVPHADVVIAHGGLGTITGTLIHGVPMVLFDIAVDHRVNIDRCVRLGIAEGLPGRGWTAEDLKSAVERTLASDKRAVNARAIAAEIAALPTPLDLVQVLEAEAERPQST